MVHLRYVTLSYNAVCKCLYLGNYCIDFNATCTKLIVIKFVVHLLWFCINEMLEVRILHTWLWGMWPTVHLCLWVGLVHLTSLIINQSNLICSAIHGRSRLGFNSWSVSTAMQERRLVLQAIPLCRLGPRPNQPQHESLVLWTWKEGRDFGHIFMFWWNVQLWYLVTIWRHPSPHKFSTIHVVSAVFDSPAACYIWLPYNMLSSSVLYSWDSISIVHC